LIAKIIVDHRSKMVDKAFDYLIPEELEDKITIGSRVIVPFSSGNVETEGFCIGVADESKTDKLKSIIKLASDTNAFDETMLETIEWMREHYLSSYLDLIHAVVPAGTTVKNSEWIILEEMTEERSPIRQKIIEYLADNGGGMESTALYNMFDGDIKSQVRDMIKKGTLSKEYRQSQNISDKKIRMARLAVTPETAKKEVIRLEKKAPVQSRMLSILSDCEFIALADLKKFSQGTYNASATLQKKGLIEFFEMTVERDPLAGKHIAKTSNLIPTEEQKNAIDSITASIESGKHTTYLLHGVTGSGKTEVFMQTIENALNLGKSALVLVPEISLTPQMVSRFVSRFSERVAVFHSGLSMGERYDQWKRIKEGMADIVIGARSAVFAPLDNIGVIIIDEEHSDTYKSEMSPRYQAKEVAEFRAKQYGAAVVLASATPSIESSHKARTGKYKLLTMKNRYNMNQMPEISIVDMRNELSKGNKSMFSTQLYNEIAENLERGEQTILFLNRRGFSTFVSCRSCGYVVECPNCNISLTYHKYEDSLKCHYCGYTTPNYTRCPKCKSPYIRYFGGGTQRVEEEINKLFPDATTLRMDVDTTERKQSHEKILEKFEKEKIDILIGTQMVAKGLDFENVTLVGVISADTMLHINDFRSRERTFAMLEQVSGRAGRGNKAGRAIIQTYSPENEAITLVKAHDYISFYNGEITERRLMWYPPFAKIICVQFQGVSQTLVPQAAKYFFKQLGEISLLKQKIQILGPIPSSVSRIKNKYRWQLLIKCEKDDELNKILKNAENACRKNKNYKSISIIIDKNPNMIY
jgi:primosomal protein N' (replication factor Y)